jgi:hypothetical protein
VTDRPITIKYDDPSHRYWITREDGSWMEVESVSTIAKALYPAPNEAMAWWGMRVGFGAVVAMMGEVGWAQIANANTPDELIRPHTLVDGKAFYRERDTSRTKPKTLIEAWAIDHKRDANNILKEAGDRGTSIHQVLEDLAIDQIPDPADYPAEHRGWIAGICQYWLDQQPTFVDNEVMVASRKHAYAGRFDCVVEYPNGRTVLTDLKTSRRPYLSHMAQLVLYRQAYAETFPEAKAFDGLEVLHVTDDGAYELIECRLDFTHVEPGLSHYVAQQQAQKIHPDL